MTWLRTFTKPTTILGWLILVVVVVVLLLSVSWVAGQFKGYWGPPKPPPVVPGYVDPGVPIAGPIAEAPTVPVDTTIATPDLTREQILAAAKKYGLVLAPSAPKPGRSGERDSTATPRPPTTTPEADRPFEARLWAEEHFSFDGVPGIGVDVSAWQLEQNERIDLRAKWSDYQPLAPCAPPAPYFGNEARFHRYLIAGGLAVKAGSETKMEPGIGGGISYEGWRIKKVTLDAHIAGMIGQSGDFAAFGGVGLGW